EAQEGAFPEDWEVYDSLIVLGGPMGVYEMNAYPFLRKVAQILEQAMAKGKRVLGICLGSQLIAHVLGARVYKGSAEEIGWKPITLTYQGLEDPLMQVLVPYPSSSLPSSASSSSGSSSFSSKSIKQTEARGTDAKVLVFHWHGDTFDLPRESVHLASSEQYPHQAFRYGSTVYALQFHLEVTPDLLDAWFTNHPMRKDILEGANQHWQSYLLQAKRFYDAFFAL
ncbi:MAG: hypothetical protein SNJ78_13015, partial [Spirochaetales bacterium]